MSGNANKSAQPQEVGPYEAALWAVVLECVVAKACSQPNKALILALVTRVSKDVKDAALERVRPLLEAPVARGGETYEKVVSFIDRNKRRDWTASELASRLNLTPREVANVTGYLTKVGRFRRLARGYYQDQAGNVFVTADELRVHDIPRGSENED